MKVRSGSAIVTVVWAIAGVTALGVGGYSYMTGNTLCSLVGSCDSGAQVSSVASTDGDSCCALKSAAAQATVAAAPSECSTKSECSSKATEVVAVNAAATENAEDCGECPFAAQAIAASNSECSTKSECSQAAQATNVVAAAPSECSLKSECSSEATAVVAAAPSECCASKAAQATEVVAAAPSECSANKTCSDTNQVAQTQAIPVTNASWTLASAGFPMAMPVFHYECGAVAADCSVASICSTKQVIAAGTCGGESSCETQATNVIAVNAATTECATGAECAEAVAASSTCCESKKAAKAVDAVAVENTKACGPDCQLACCISE